MEKIRSISASFHHEDSFASGEHIVPESPTGNPGEIKRDNKSRDGSSGEGYEISKLTRKPTYKEQKRIYKEEKKRLTDEILHCLSESTFLLESGWLKARTTIKTWTKIWCELKPAGLILYRSERVNETSAWNGTILLNVCRIIERPSKKEGFCFKIYHPLDQSIWTSKGPHGEMLKGFGVPLPVDHVIFRAPNEAKGREWLSSIELVIKHSPDYFTQPNHAQGGLREGLRRTVSQTGPDNVRSLDRSQSETGSTRIPLRIPHPDGQNPDETDSQEEDDEEDDNLSQNGGLVKVAKMEGEDNSGPIDTSETTLETSYSLNQQEELGESGGLETKLPDEERSLFWHLLLQVRPGMDLSKVVLPTFILDPRSFLDKLSDYYYHADLIAKASQYDSPFERMKGIIVWYFSGFYKKPKGVKKPYNPILGETFRCCWDHSDGEPSRTFYIAEQVSHHPPVTAWYVSNRRAGFTVSGSVLAKSKFKGNSIQALLEGSAKVRLLSRGEEYVVTMPHVVCKGMIYGKLAMDLGGRVSITCLTTGYVAEINFSIWMTRAINPVDGKIKLGDEVMATLHGSWDGEIIIKDAATRVEESCWKPIPEKRLRRLTVDLARQVEYESEKLWSHVTAALQIPNQEDATREKTFLEDRQRREAKERLAKGEVWIAHHFVQDEFGDWTYRHLDFRPWDSLLDQKQYEHGFIIQTKTLYKGPHLHNAESRAFELGPDPPRGSRHSSLVVTARRRGHETDTSSTGSSKPNKTAKSTSRPGKPGPESMYPEQEKMRQDLETMRTSLQTLVFQGKSIEKIARFTSRNVEILLMLVISAGVVYLYRLIQTM